MGKLTRLLLFAMMAAPAWGQQQPASPASGQVALPTPLPTATPSVVYFVHNPEAIVDFHPDARIVHGMVNRLVTAVTGEPDVARAWSSLVQPNDKVGIKISAAGGEIFTTHRDVVEAIVDGLVSAGHAENNIASRINCH